MPLYLLSMGADEKRKKHVHRPFEGNTDLPEITERPGNSQYLSVGRIS